MHQFFNNQSAFLLLMLSVSLHGMQESISLEKKDIPFFDSSIIEESDAIDLPVSYIYYPTGHDCPYGCAKLEVKGSGWLLSGEEPYESMPIKTMIERAECGGIPFFRFIFNVDHEQIALIAKLVSHKGEYLNCAHGALQSLAHANVCNVPYPFRLSPLFAALYLKVGKELTLNGVQQIEYHGNNAPKRGFARIVMGPVLESLHIGTVGVLWAYVAKGCLGLVAKLCYDFC